MQRFEELKFLMNMETDPVKKEAYMETIRAFVKQGQELVVTNLCDTSSDEDETREIVSDVTKSSIEETEEISGAYYLELLKNGIRMYLTRR